MRSTKTIYVTSPEEYDNHKGKLKFVPCPYCRAVGYLIGHGYLRGRGEGASDEVRRGWRVFCSSRNRRKGCGRTYCVLLAQFMSRRMVSSAKLWHLIDGIRKGLSVKAAWEKVSSPFCLETGYRLCHAFARSQTFIRSLLLRAGALPKFSSAEPLLQVIEHLRALFPQSACPVADFQIRFQTAFLHTRAPRLNRSG